MSSKKILYRIKPHFTVITHTLNQVELRKGIWNPVSYTLKDDKESNKLAKIILNLDGSKTVSEISAEYQVKSSEIELIIDHLRRLGVIEINASNLIDYYIEEAKLPFHSINSQSKHPVIFLGDNEINNTIIHQVKPYFDNTDHLQLIDSEHSFWKMLTSGNEDEIEQELNIQKYCKQAEHLRGALVILTMKTINPHICLKFNRLAYEVGINWMYGCIDVPMIYIGPMFFASKGPCYYCFEKRISLNLIENHSYVEYKNALTKNNVKTSEFVTPLLTNLLASHLSVEITNYILTKSTYLSGRVLSMYLPTKEIGYNELLRFPDCPVCGSVRERNSQTTYFDRQVILQEERYGN